MSVLANCRSVALRGMREVQVVRRARPQRSASRGQRRPGLGVGVRSRRWRVAPSDAARTRRTQGLLTLAVHALRQVSTEH